MSLRIAFIGSGFAQEYITALASIPGTQVVAICSRTGATARNL